MKPASAVKPITQSIAGRWQGVKDGREGLFFEPTAPKEGSASFFYDGHRYEKTRYRLEKSRLLLPDRRVTYSFKVEKGMLSLWMADGKEPKRYRSVKKQA
jgi:hypothetical protein